jgi:CrcB protein
LRKYVFLGCGCFVGAIARYLLEGMQIPGYREDIPLITLFINISGAFLMGFLLTLFGEMRNFDADLRLGLTTGLLGAYTTFSTMCKETSNLLFRGEYFSALSYLTVSTVLGLGAVYFGTAAARELASRLLQKKQETIAFEPEEEGAD